MPRVIVKCRYYQTDKTHKNIGGLMKYVATREGVDKRTDEWKNQAATDEQINMINHIIATIPACQQSIEFGYYERSKTRGDASEFISSAIETHPQLMQENSYLSYMAMRPRVDKGTEKHGLFSDSDKVLDLDDEVEKLRQFNGNVFTVIVSLKREDATRLGYDNAERWKGLARAHIDYIAEQYKIPKKDLRWYAAFHNESHHPHIHMLLYSTNETAPGYINNKGINNLRHMFGTEIFADDIRKIYDRQTEVRNKLTDEARSRFKALIDSVNNGGFVNEKLLRKLEELARRLRCCKGKKQYGYLPKGLKDLVDEIVEDVSVDDRIRELYDIWYQAKCAVYETYTDVHPEKLPLSKEKVFKPIRNALVQEAVQLRDEIIRNGEKANDYGSKTAKSESKNEKKNGAGHKGKVMGAALRFGRSMARVFEDNLKKYDPDEDDIDKQLRREIQAVKNGQNLVM